MIENINRLRFSFAHYYNGSRSQYGIMKDLLLDDAVEELIYYDLFSKVYDKEQLKERLLAMKPGVTWEHGQSHQIKVYKTIIE